MRLVLPAMPSVTLRAILCMILSAFCFAFIEMAPGPLISDISLYQVVWGRYAVHLLFMVVVLGPRYQGTLVKSSKLRIQILRSLTMLAMPICFIVALNTMPPHNIWSVYWTSPLVMLALSVWVLHEPAGARRWVAAVVGFVGMLFVWQPDQGIFSPTAVLAFGVGLAISLHLMFSRILRHNHPLTSLFHTALWVFMAMCFIVPLFWTPLSTRNVAGLIIIGLVGLVTLYVLARSGELAPIPVVAGFAYTEAIFRLGLNVVLYGILPDKSQLLGGLIIIGVTGYLLYHELRQPRVEAVIEQAAATH